MSGGPTNAPIVIYHWPAKARASALHKQGNAAAQIKKEDVNADKELKISEETGRKKRGEVGGVLGIVWH
jgi:hypothetical protein